MPSKAVLLFDQSAFHLNNLNDGDTLQRMLSCLRVVCLRLLAEFNNRSAEFLFGCKIFDSRGNLIQKMEKLGFCDLNLESFKDLETKLSLCYERSRLSNCHNSTIQKVTEPSIKILNKALTEVLCDFQWDSSDVWSPIRNSKHQLSDTVPVSNLVFLFSYCPVVDDYRKVYFNTDSVLSIPTLQNMLMPPALKTKFVNDLCISLVWVDTSEFFTKDTVALAEFLESQKLFHAALRNLNGTYLSLKALAQACMVTSSNSVLSQNCTDGLHNEELYEENIMCSVADPFSLTLAFCIEKNCDTCVVPSKNCCISFFSGEQFDVVLFSTFLSHFRVQKDVSITGKQCSLTQEFGGEFKNQKLKFVVCGAVQAKFYGAPSFAYFCVPEDEGSSSENLSTFTRVLKSLVTQNKYLVLKAESTPNTVGIIHPLSALSAALMVFDEAPALLNTILSGTPSANSLSLEDLANIQAVDELDVLKSNVTEPKSDVQCSAVSSEDLAVHMLSQQSCIATDQKEASSELLFESPSREYQCLESFLKKLQHHQSGEKERLSELNSPRESSPRRSAKRQRNSPGCSRTAKFRKGCARSKSPHIPVAPSQNFLSLPSTLSEADCQDEKSVVQHLKNLYDTCIESGKDILQTSRTLLGDAIFYLKSKMGSLDKGEVSKFLEEHIFLSLKGIQEKYLGKDDQQSVKLKTKEFQLQTILILEFEAEFSSTSPSKCVKTVTALLRGFSFIVGPSELLKFLQEHVKEQYSQNLHHVLTEVGDELNVPLIPEPFSPSSPSEIGSPGQMSQLSASPCSSLIAGRSSSSAFSQMDEVSKRRTIARHSSFSGNFQSRQIMIPKELLKKEKPKPKTEIRLLRRSPRLSMRKSNEVPHRSNPPSSKSVRRNLFNVEKRTSRSPKKKSMIPTKTSAKKKLFRSKSHSFRRTIVPETPSPKQGKSALRRKLARLQQHLTSKNAVQVIAESPVTSKSDVLRSRLNGVTRNKNAPTDRKHKT